ncbi:kinase-like domain-containing protein [Zychaea mexicana]|uniref:kinase-like domain-containing protein n=1 Tax=Zychaea mexicana TaxID=64656 RepID=UPI0022FE8BB2|nr:kinase-like domain-containing protein [Zychaea mexicana]KAI9496037.1 kinase-like domain-containing protein [Zychaea mexicana]
MRIVGRGAFGKVRIVEHRESHQLYALKYISKEECIQMEAARNIIRERTILEQLDHTFLCRLRFAFQDDEFMYMVTDLMLGGDMHYHISREHFSEDVLRFWFAELATGIKYLHCKRVVHRDIKPQNILLDDKGHVHITDFNIATYLHSRRVLTSNSGTGYYMAPEIYKGGGYNEAVDWWSLGVTLYECVYQKRPFECTTSEELKMAVRRGVIHYPDDSPVSGECLSVIQGFLEMNPNKRLGQGDEGWAALVRHPFFRPIDWRRLETKRITPPFQPATDRNNFDPTFDLEELILGDTSMSAQARRQLKQQQQARIPKTIDEQQMTKRDRDLQLIEEKFVPFDYTVFEKYEGFKDPLRMTVGDPPDWVKPAFEGAEQGDLLPVKRITTVSVADWQQQPDDEVGATAAANNMPSVVRGSGAPVHHPHHPRSPVVSNKRDSWRGPNRSASTSNIAANVVGHNFGDVPWKRRSLGVVRVKHQGGDHDLAGADNAAATAAGATSPGSPSSAVGASLSEEYAISLQGVRKKQSTKSFRDRRERDRKSINHHVNIDTTEPSAEER